ncbi:MAG: RhuM family protein [Chitinophagales bacterium]
MKTSISNILIYEVENGQTQIEVQLENETVWLTQKQMGILFERKTPTVNEHIKNIFKEGELEKDSVIRKSLTTASDGKNYNTNHYNLDVIISVGYRIKSKRGTQFRIWANRVLKEYLLQGYVLNEQKLQEAEEKYADLQKAVALVAQISHRKYLNSTEAQGILTVLERYAYALETLDKYDHQALEIETNVSAPTWKLTYAHAIHQIAVWKEKQQATQLFGNEKDESFKSSLYTIYQTFDGIDLYPSLEEKAANLLYFIVKNHSFSDGNKRIAAGLFAYFLSLNQKLYRSNGTKRIADNALVAITIMIAESKPEEKDTMVKLVVNLINYKN